MMLSPTNKRFGIAEAGVELELRGCESFEDREEGSIVARRSRCSLGFMTRIDYYFFVRQVDHLSLERINADLANLPDMVEQRGFGGLPPFGVSRGNMIILVYLADSIDPSALAKITQVPKKEWCSCTFLAAQDGQGTSFFLEDTTPTWGFALFPQLRYWAGLLTGRPVGDRPPGDSKLIMAVNVLSITYACWVFITIPRGGVLLLCLLVTMLLAGIAATLVQAWRRRRRHRYGLQRADMDTTALIC
jgi:hypothetical protein